MTTRRNTHPLFYLVGVLGVVFTVSACAYGVMSFRTARGGDAYGQDTDAGLMRLMREHGGTVLGVEIAALAVASVAAMAADGRQAKRSPDGAGCETGDDARDGSASHRLR